MSDICAYRIRVSGRVQGVGYRYSAMQKARRYRLTGWVRNMQNGDVEVFCQGPANMVDQFIHWLRRGPELAHVYDLYIHPVPLDQTVSTFFITY